MAALQLANMPDEAAAALLTKLNARTASAILSEMEAARDEEGGRDGTVSDLSSSSKMGKKSSSAENLAGSTKPKAEMYRNRCIW